MVGDGHRASTPVAARVRHADRLVGARAAVVSPMLHETFFTGVNQRLVCGRIDRLVLGRDDQRTGGSPRKPASRSRFAAIGSAAAPEVIDVRPVIEAGWICAINRRCPLDAVWSTCRRPVPRCAADADGCAPNSRVLPVLASANTPERRDRTTRHAAFKAAQIGM